MQLWQIDIKGGVFLADGRECKVVTGIDDHSRFVVVVAVVADPGSRAVCAAFSAAMTAYGVPLEVLTDNGKQFTGRFTKPYPAEVIFERICRENGITTRLTKPRSPTATGKIERFPKTLRRELLESAGPVVGIEAAQEAIDAWVHGYSYSRPPQSLGMATSATCSARRARRDLPAGSGGHRITCTRRRRPSPSPATSRTGHGTRADRGRSRCRTGGCADAASAAPAAR